MLNRLVAVLSLAAFAQSALGAETPLAPAEATVTFTADSPNATLEVSPGRTVVLLGLGSPTDLAVAPSWTPLCHAPCRASVRLVDELRVGGDGIQPSSRILINPRTTELSVDARTGSSTAHVLGISSIVAGAISFTVGMTFLTVGAMGYSFQDMTIGAVSMGVGVGITALGVLLSVLAGNTRLDLEGGREGSRT